MRMFENLIVIVIAIETVSFDYHCHHRSYHHPCVDQGRIFEMIVVMETGMVVSSVDVFLFSMTWLSDSNGIVIG